MEKFLQPKLFLIEKPADPEEAAALCQDDIEEMDFGGLHYYVTVKTFGDGEDAS